MDSVVSVAKKMRNGFLDDLPELDLPAAKRTRKKKVVRLQPEDVVIRYQRPKCPKCGSAKVPVYDSSHLPIRYHKCSRCGLNFKSIEATY